MEVVFVVGLAQQYRQYGEKRGGFGGAYGCSTGTLSLSFVARCSHKLMMRRKIAITQ